MGLVCLEPVHTVVCTASEELALRLNRMLRRWAASECVTLALEQRDRITFQEKPTPELVILDMDTVDLPEQGRREKEKGGLIVISRDAGRAIHSYRWHPAAFLKPDFDERRLGEALTSCEKNWRRGRVCLEAPYRRQDLRLPLGRIRYVEASAHYCLFNQGRQTVRLRFVTSELAELLPNPPFVRCHRSYLVHLGAIKAMTYTTITLQGGGSLPLGRTYIQPLRQALLVWQNEEENHVDLGADLR